MSILLTILKIILYIILAVIGLVLILSIFPVSAKILFRAGKLYLDLKYLFLKFQILPAKGKKPDTDDQTESVLTEETVSHAEETEETVSYELTNSVLEESIAEEQAEEEQEQGEKKEEEKPQKEKKKKPKDDEEEEEKENTLVALWKKIKPFVTPTTKTLIALFHHIHMKDVEIVWNVRSNDAARVGMLSGLAWLVIGDVMRTFALLFGKNLSYKEVTVQPCFDPKDGADERFGCEVAVRPIIILLIAIYFLFLYVKEKLFSR